MVNAHAPSLVQHDVHAPLRHRPERLGLALVEALVEARDEHARRVRRALERPEHRIRKARVDRLHLQARLDARGRALRLAHVQIIRRDMDDAQRVDALRLGGGAQQKPQ